MNQNRNHERLQLNTICAQEHILFVSSVLLLFRFPSELNRARKDILKSKYYIDHPQIEKMVSHTTTPSDLLSHHPCQTDSF